MESKNRIECVVDLLIHDLTNRKGFDWVWDGLEEEIQDDIKMSWSQILMEYEQNNT